MSYTPDLLAHYKAPQNRGALASPTHTGEASNPLCGDALSVHLHVVDGAVVDAKFDGVGCAISIASASIQTEHWRGKPVEALLVQTPGDLVALLGSPVAPGRHDCVQLIVRALQDCMAAPQSS